MNPRKKPINESQTSMQKINIKERILEGSKAYQAGKAKYQNWGLGLMTQEQRDTLMAHGKIMQQDGQDVICTEPMGVLDYGDPIKCVVFKGSFEGIKFQMDEFKNSIKRYKIWNESIEPLPLWDGNLSSI